MSAGVAFALGLVIAARVCGPGVALVVRVACVALALALPLVIVFASLSGWLNSQSLLSYLAGILFGALFGAVRWVLLKIKNRDAGKAEKLSAAGRREVF